ncbi:MAG: arginine repressor [Lachnospiraceae bacterium]|jgi:transcriptional regulator of arginine metabolism|nr:arginine repressor [Lachnospiraceae bacterium]
MKKKDRQEKIKELIRQYEVETQEELAEYLQAAGFQVTQATVSRDIRELKLSKIATNAGRQVYTLFLAEDDEELEEKYIAVLQSGFVSLEVAQSILVLKTVAGMAMAVAATIDAMKFPEVAGSIGGDDTVMMAARSVTDALAVRDKILDMVERE